MTAIPLASAPRARPSEQPPGVTPARGPASALPFAHALLSEQGVPLLARRTAARALALLLARSVARPGEPVVLSAHEGAHLCDFEPRTWWLVKRRLLELGHLVASTGGGAPSGRPGGRGHKGSYFVAPATLARFQAQTEKDLEETLKGPPQTLKVGREERNLSHHRSLRLLEKKRTSDVPSLEGDEPGPSGERPSVEAVWAWIRRERSLRVRLRLLRLLETLLLTEALARSGETVNGERSGERTLNAPSKARERHPRAPKPLWSPRGSEEEQVFAHVRSILEWANREHGAKFDVEKSARDTLRYPFERVRAAVANVLLKKARGYSFENAGAVLWEGVTLEGYKLEEFSVACFDEVLARLGRSRPGEPPERRAELPPSVAPPSLRFEPERRRRALLQDLYEKLPEPERRSLDERAESLARGELGASASAPRLRLLQLDKRNELLASLAGPSFDAGGSEKGARESQIPHFASGRDEPEPIVHSGPRT